MATNPLPVAAARQQCEGFTKEGVRCRRFPQNGERHCWQHTSGLWPRLRAWTEHPVLVFVLSVLAILGFVLAVLAFLGIQLLPTTVLLTKNDGVLIAPKTNDTMNLLKIGDSASLIQSIRGEELDRKESSFAAFDSDLYIWKTANRYHVSASIRDEQGNLMLTIKDNRWHIYPSFASDWNFSNTALEVKDNQGRIIFQMALLPSCVEMQARLITGHGEEIGFYSLAPSGPAVLWTPPTHGNQLPILIRPIFEYPSSESRGKMTPMGKTLDCHGDAKDKNMQWVYPPTHN